MRPTVHLLALTIAAMPGATFADEAGIEIVTGVTETGRATPEWQAMIRKRLPDDAFEVVRELEKPLTGNERAWANMIRARAALWKAETAALADVFRPIKAPHALIVLGNRGGEDAFTHDPHTIGFDLERLHALYGAAASAENQARMDRFFRHEYTHLLQKAWFVEHPVPLDSPLDRTLTEIFTEGMGNYHSLSDSWRNRNGKAAEKTLETLALLEPRFIARLAATACTTEETAAELRADLSSGRFDRKWGALPVALWLELESSERGDVLREFLLAGTDGIWTLAKRHMSPDLRPVLDEIRSAHAICSNK